MAPIAGSIPSERSARSSSRASGAQLEQPDLFPYLLWCGNEMRGLVWLDLNAGGDPAPALDPQTIAMHLRDEIPVPNAEIRINPNRGLVGVDSWFWIDGYDGSPIEESTDAFGQLVEVEARVTRYEWSFGDGETLVAKTLGRSYPHRSADPARLRALVRGACLRLSPWRSPSPSTSGIASTAAGGSSSRASAGSPRPRTPCASRSR